MIGKNYIEREKLTHICQKGDSGNILCRLKKYRVTNSVQLYLVK